MDESDIEDEEILDEQSEESLDPNNPDDAFRILERDFNKTLAQLESQPDAAQYADDFSKIFETAFKLKIKEKELSDEIEALTTTVNEQDNKLQLAQELATKDKETIDELKQNIIHVCRLADAAHYREQSAQEIIDNLRKQVETLNAEIDFKNKMAADSEDAGKSHKEKDLLQREKERLTTENGYLQQKLSNCNAYTQELEEKTSEANLKINEISGQLEDQASEIDRMKKFREKLETELVAVKNTVEEKDVNIHELHTTIGQFEKKVVEQEIEIKHQKSNYIKVSKDFYLLEAKYQKLMADHQKTVSYIDQAKKDLQAKILDLKGVTDEVVHLKADVANLTLQRDALEKQIYKHVAAVQTVSNDRNVLRQKIAIIEKEVDDAKKEISEHKRVAEDILKEKNNISKMVIKAQAVNKEQARLIKIQEKSKEKLEQELDLFFLENGKQKKELASLQKEKDRYAEGQIEMTKKIDDLMEDIRQKKVYIFDLKKTITEYINKVRQQQNLYEAVRTERAGLQKSLEQCSADSDELKKKFKITLYQTEQLKEEVSAKEQELIKQDTVMRKVVKERENLKIEVDRGLEQVRSLKSEIRDILEEQKRLRKSLIAGNKKIREQLKTIEQLMNERDVLGSQLVRRNDELALNNDKIKILVTTLHRGEAQYDQRLGDIRLLKIEVKRLRQEKLLMEKSVLNMINFRQEVFRLERDLTTSKLKCRALEEELHNPVNIHRWRKLEGSDPDTLELLQKIKILQKRLLRQSYEAIDREKQLKESEQLYIKLKEVLAHQPGPTIREDLNRAQKALKQKDEKLKVLVSELNMSELKSVDYKSQLDKITDELKEMKKKYLLVKKANRMQRMTNESSQELNRSRSHQHTSEVKFTGGGFKMSVPQISTK